MKSPTLARADESSGDDSSPVSGVSASAAASAIGESLDTIDSKGDHSSEDDLSSEDSDTGDRVDSPST